MKCTVPCCMAVAIALAAGAPLRAQQLTNLTFSPGNASTQTVIGGAPTTGTVTLSSAPAADLQVALTNSNTLACTVPIRVTVLAGHTAGTFCVDTARQTYNRYATITASANSSTVSGVVAVIPGLMQTLPDIADSYIEGGASATKNFGKATSLLLRAGGTGSSSLNDAAVIEMNLTGIGEPPDGAELEMTAVSPTGPSSADFTFSIYVQPFTTWYEPYVTWNTCPGFNPTTFAGTGVYMGTYTVPLTQGRFALDVRNLVRGFVGHYLSLLLIPAAGQGTNELAIASREAASGAPVISVTYNRATVDTPVPGWAEDSQAVDGIDTGGGGMQGNGPSEANTVNLATGVFDHHPRADLTVYNPAGPSVCYARRYRSSLAQARMSAPGLTPGWTDNWDYQVSGPAGAWGVLTLSYPNRATEQLTPVLSGSNPTGVISAPLGAPYFVTGVPKPGATSWQSITITFKDLTSLTFVPTAANPNVYLIGGLGDAAGNMATVARNPDNTIASISQGAVTLLAMTYTSGVLRTVSTPGPSGTTRVVSYTYTSLAGFTGHEIARVSQVYTGGANNPRWTYGYTVAHGVALLTSTAAPGVGSGALDTSTVLFDASMRVARQVSATGFVRAYLYSGAVCRVWTGSTVGSFPYVADKIWYVTTSASRVAGITDAAGVATTTTYSPQAPFDVATQTNRNGQVSTVTYDAAAPVGNAISVQQPCVGGTLTRANSWSYALFPTGQLASTQTGPRTPTVFTYYNGTTLANGILQAKGLLATVSVPAPGSVFSGATVTYTYTYTTLGSLATAVVPAPGPTGSVTYTFTYTGTMADGTVRTAEARGEPVTVTDPVGHITTFAWDMFGNLTAVSNPNGDTTRFTYTAPYDACHQLTRVDFPKTALGSSSPAAYQTYLYQYPGGPLIQSRQYASATDTFPFAGYTRQANAEDQLGLLGGGMRTTRMLPDYLARLMGIGDANFDGPFAQYDHLGNLASIQSTIGAYRAFSYDHDYNLTSQADGNGNTTTFALDNGPGGDNRIKYVVYPPNPAAGVAPLNNARYTYDAMGRVVDVSNIVQAGSTYTGTADVRYAYDDGDRILSQTTTYVNGAGTGLLPPLTVSYTYNADGSRDSMTTPAGTYSYTYNAAGVLTAEQVPWGDIVTYLYSASGQVIRQTCGLGSSSYVYTPAGFLTTLVNKSAYQDAAGNSTLSAFSSLGRDANGNLVSSDESVPEVQVTGGSYSAGTSGTVAYQTIDGNVNDEDASHRSVVGASGGDTLFANYHYGFSIDFVGNFHVIRRTATAVGAGLNFNRANEVSAGYEFGKTIHDVYDGEGNPTSYFMNGAQAPMVWDLENRLTRCPYYTATYRPDGLRAAKASAGQWYVYDGDKVTAVVDGTGAVTSAFAFGPKGLVERYPGAGTNYYWYTFDPSGNVIERSSLANASGAGHQTADWVTRYDAFGGQLGCINPATGAEADASLQDAVGYAGQYGALTDQETAPIGATTVQRYPLVHMAYREYDPALARWINPNPAGCTGSPNLYLFSYDNPVTSVDTTGLDGPLPGRMADAVDAVAASSHPYGLLPEQRSLQAAYGLVLPDVLSGVSTVDLPAVQFTLPAVQRTVPAVQRTMMNVSQTEPAVQAMLPYLTGATPGLYEGQPALRRGLPATASSVPAVQRANLGVFPFSRLWITARAPNAVTSPLELPHPLPFTFTGDIGR